jgi:hypothetical protein
VHNVGSSIKYRVGTVPGFLPALSGLAKIVAYRIPGRRFALPWAIASRPVGA